MRKLALLNLFLLIIFTLSNIIDGLLDIESNDLEENYIILPRKITKQNSERIWILSFEDEYDLNVLRSPNRAEINVFNKIISPAIIRMENGIMDNKANQQNNKEHFTDKSDKENITITQIRKSLKNFDTRNLDSKYELKRIINKFLFIAGLSDHSENLSTNSKEPNLKLYFKGLYCSLILESGRYKNQYFTNSDSELLPKWFYEEHKNIKHDDKGDFVEIPEDVRTEFYDNFLNLLNTFFGYAI